MAIITEEEEVKQEEEAKPSLMAESSSKPGIVSINTDSRTGNAFVFWAYFTVAVSVITLVFVSLSSIIPQDDKSWFLSLPNDLRLHYSKGRTIKVQLNPDQSSIEVFAIEEGPREAETVVFVHGFGCTSYSFRQVVKSLGSRGIHAVAIDLPGSGFSDKSTLEEDPRDVGGVLGRIWDVYSDIKEKGLFWGFDHLIETGHIPYDETKIRVSTSARKIFKPLELGSEDMGRIIGQVLSSMGLAPVHLVLHDSALGVSASWIMENSGSVSSITLVDSTSKSMALPLWVLRVPIIREFVLGFSFVYVRLLRICCSRSIDAATAESHRVLVKGRDGRRALVGVGMGLNCSFDLGDWAGTEAVKGLPVQVLWSGSWSNQWSEEGRRVANALPLATFITHSGGRWPQVDIPDEIADMINQFVSTLPKSVRHVDKDVPDIHKMSGAAKDNSHHNYEDHSHGGHDHGHAPGFMNAYGLDHGWGS